MRQFFVSHAYPLFLKNSRFIMYLSLISLVMLFPDRITFASENQFKPGIGPPVGMIQFVEGPAFIIHANESKRYKAENVRPLFEGDTIFTTDKGRTALLMNDKSIFSLGYNSSLVISRGEYDPAHLGRSFLIKVKGNIFFWIKKIPNLFKSDVRAITKTAIIGVRGSSFIVRADDRQTGIFTSYKNHLAVWGLSYPDANPVILRDFEMTSVQKGMLPSKAEKVSRVKILNMLREFIIKGISEKSIYVPRKKKVPKKQKTGSYSKRNQSEIPEDVPTDANLAKDDAQFVNYEYESLRNSIEAIREIKGDIEKEKPHVPQIPGVPGS